MSSAGQRQAAQEECPTKDELHVPDVLDSMMAVRRNNIFDGRNNPECLNCEGTPGNSHRCGCMDCKKHPIDDALN